MLLCGGGGSMSQEMWMAGVLVRALRVPASPFHTSSGITCRLKLSLQASKPGLDLDCWSC